MARHIKVNIYIYILNKIKCAFKFEYIFYRITLMRINNAESTGCVIATLPPPVNNIERADMQIFFYKEWH